MKTIQFSLLIVLSLSTPTLTWASPLDFIFKASCFTRKPAGESRSIVRRYLEEKKFFTDTSWKNREVKDRTPDFLNDFEYLEEMKYVDSTLGIVDTKFDPEFDTQFYYTATSKPRSDGTIPMVDPAAKALVVYLHGSGTMKASGAGFAGKMNSLAKMGYASLSFDLPFHRMGSKNPALSNTKEFADYMERIIQKHKVPGQPVILVGHSFGPDIIAEYVTRYPHSVNSAVLVSPGGFDEVTTKWYNEKTAKMDFGEMENNDAGGLWAGMVTTDNTWNNLKAPGRVDPTEANPDLKLFVISGDREEYIPGELDAAGKPTDKPRDYDVKAAFEKIFKRVDVTIEPGAGHLLFQHKDANGHDVMLRSVLKADNETLDNEKELKMAFMNSRLVNRPSYETLAIRYTKEPFLKKFMDQVAAKEGTTSKEMIKTFIADDDKKGAQAFLTKYMTVERQRKEALNKNIKATSSWAPEFYTANKDAIDKLGEKGFEQTAIQAKYAAFLQTLPKEKVKAHAVASQDVYVIPEKPQRQGPPEGFEHFQKKDKKQKKQKQEQNQQQKQQPSPEQ